MAVQGGLLASVVANQPTKSIWPTASFLIAKLLSYIILGFLLGGLGKIIAVTDTVRIAMQLLAGIYMVIVALDLLRIHPFFHYFIIKPPKFLTKIVKNQSKSNELFAPALLGVLTIFIPCGTTLAMETLAISTGSPFKGAVIMGIFILGTTPLFLGLGTVTSFLKDAFREKFFKLAALVIIYLGVSSINVAFNMAGYSLSDLIPFEIRLAGTDKQNSVDPNVNVVNGISEVNIRVLPEGYDPSLIKVKRGMPVKLNLSVAGKYGCAAAFTIPKFGIRELVPRQGSIEVMFTPEEKGKVLFTCSMGMYSGNIEVI